MYAKRKLASSPALCRSVDMFASQQKQQTNNQIHQTAYQYRFVIGFGGFFYLNVSCHNKKFLKQ